MSFQCNSCGRINDEPYCLNCGRVEHTGVDKMRTEDEIVEEMFELGYLLGSDEIPDESILQEKQKKLMEEYHQLKLAKIKNEMDCWIERNDKANQNGFVSIRSLKKKIDATFGTEEKEESK